MLTTNAVCGYWSPWSCLFVQHTVRVWTVYRPCLNIMVIRTWMGLFIHTNWVYGASLGWSSNQSVVEDHQRLTSGKTLFRPHYPWDTLRCPVTTFPSPGCAGTELTFRPHLGRWREVLGSDRMGLRWPNLSPLRSHISLTHIQNRNTGQGYMGTWWEQVWPS